MKLRNALITSTLMLTLLLTGCGSDSDSAASVVTDITPQRIPGDEITATFIDTIVEGLQYKGLLSGSMGETNNKGELKCEIGENVEFSIGGLVLGKSPCKEHITPFTMEDNKIYAAHLGMILIPIDVNGDLSDGITIPRTLRKQDYLRANLSDFIEDESQVINLVNSLIDNAPANTFFGGGNLISREDVRDHYSVSFIPMGRYEGRVTELLVNDVDGQCEERKLIRATVGPHGIKFPGFAGLNPDEMSIKIPRKINTDLTNNSFEGTFELRQFENSETNNVISPRLYERVIINGTIREGKVRAYFELGDVDTSNNFIPSCTGFIDLEKEEPIPSYFPVRRISNEIPNDLLALQAYVNAVDVGSDIYNAVNALVISEVALDFLKCVTDEYESIEVSYNCYNVKMQLDIEVSNVQSLINRRKASNPLIPDSLVDGINEVGEKLSVLNGILF